MRRIIRVEQRLIEPWGGLSYSYFFTASRNYYSKKFWREQRSIPSFTLDARDDEGTLNGATTFDNFVSEFPSFS